MSKTNTMILCMGLPGSGKTTLIEKVTKRFDELEIDYNWFNADKVRKQFDDWDFSEEGRLRQATRMRQLVDESDTYWNFVDMVAPTPEARDILNPDTIILMATIKEGRFEDTNKVFQMPFERKVDIMFTTWGGEEDVDLVIETLTEA